MALNQVPSAAVTGIVPVDSNISVPGAPTSVSATVADSSSAVSFVAPTSNGGSTILSYTVISSPSSIKKSGTTSPITITGLTNGTAYTFTVKAHNIAGSSIASSASNSVTANPVFNVDYLVIAGGGGGAAGGHGGGGGAGGMRCTVTNTGGGGTLESALGLSLSTNYTVTIGAGGAGGAGGAYGSAYSGSSGADSIFSTITSTGGGYGTAQTATAGSAGGTGGSGGGSGEGTGTIGLRTASPVQGFNGGLHVTSATYGGGGGGGAGAVGADATTSVGGNGGAGLATSITGSSVTYAGGGGGGTYQNSGAGGAGGSGGGGGSPGAGLTDTAGTAGTANTGSGGGSSHRGTNNAATAAAGGAGGSGIVILRYLTADGTITIGAGLTGTTATNGSYKVATITAGTGNVSWA